MNMIKKKLNERLSRLKGIVAIIKVGAVTEVEMKEKKLRIEDALSATKSSCFRGHPYQVVGSTFEHNFRYWGAEQLSDEKSWCVSCIKSVVSPLKQMCENAGS